MKSSWIGWGSAENCRVELVPVSDWSWGDKQKWIQSLRSVSSHPGTPLSPEAWFMSIRSLETIINMMCVGMGEVDHHLQWGLHQVKTATHSLRYLIHFFVDDHPAFFVWTIIWFFFSLGWPGGSSPQSIHLRRFLFLKIKAGLICIFKRRSMGTGSYQAGLATTGKLTSIWSRWERNSYQQLKSLWFTVGLYFDDPEDLGLLRWVQQRWKLKRGSRGFATPFNGVRLW